jgi:2-enoate reductase
MEAARVAALRGHSVSLWEREDRLGGNLIPASIPRFKQDIRQLVQYFSTQLPKVGVDVRLGHEATPDLVQRMRPDVVIVATGARPIIPNVAGVGQENVVTAIDLLLDKKHASQNQHVVVVGGGFIGCETAAYLAEEGNSVTLVEALPHIIGDMFLANREYLLGMLKKHNVKTLTGKTLVEIAGESALISGSGDRTEKLKADMIVLAMGLEPRLELKSALEGKISRLYAIGDCVEPRRIQQAIWEAFRLARLI